MKQLGQQVGTPPVWHLGKYRVPHTSGGGPRAATFPLYLGACHTAPQNLPATHRPFRHQPCFNRTLSWWIGWKVLKTRVGSKYDYCANIDEYHNPRDLRLAGAPLNLKYTWNRLPHCLKKNPSFVEILKSSQQRIAKDRAGSLPTAQAQTWFFFSFLSSFLFLSFPSSIWIKKRNYSVF